MRRLVRAGVDLLEYALNDLIFGSVRLEIQRTFIRVLPLEPFTKSLILNDSSPKKVPKTA